MRAPDPDNPERVLERDNSWPIVVAGAALLFLLILLTPFVLNLLV